MRYIHSSSSYNIRVPLTLEVTISGSSQQPKVKRGRVILVVTKQHTLPTVNLLSTTVVETKDSTALRQIRAIGSISGHQGPWDHLRHRARLDPVADPKGQLLLIKTPSF